MNVDPRLHEVLDDAGKVLQIARSLSIAPSPEIYELLLAYVSNSKPEVAARLNSMLDRPHPELEKQLMELHTEFFGAVSLEQDLARIRANLHAEISQVNAQLDDGMKGNLEMANVLRKSMRSATETVTREDLVAICKDVVLSSRAHLNQTQGISEQLKKTQRELGEMKQELHDLRDSVARDHLTGLLNRRHLDEMLDQLIEEDAKFSFAMIDLDHFKRINDSFGHAVGDNILRGAGKVLMQNSKGKDVAARVGGEEFALILPDTGLVGAQKLCETIRAAFADILWLSQRSDEELGRFTLSCGVTDTVAGDVGVAGVFASANT